MAIERREFLIQTAGALGAMAILPEHALAGRAFAGEQIRVGVIGTGRQGRAILAELAKLEAANVVAIADIDEARLRAGVRRARGAEGYSGHRELLEKAAVDAVFVATPTHTHREVAGDAAGAGVHVYCEAPMAQTADDCASLVRAARESTKVFHVGLPARSNPVYQLARTFYRSDAVRDLVGMRAQHHRKTSWGAPGGDNWRLDPEQSVGLAGELGTPQFDVFHWYTGKYPRKVRGYGGVRHWRDGREVADTVALQLAFDDGAVLQYDATLANSYGGIHEVLHGSNAAIKLAWTHGWMFKEADAPTQGWEVYANRQQFHRDEGITLIADATKLASQGKLQEGVGLPHEPLYYAVADFLQSCVEGSPAVVGAEEGMRATVVGILADRAVRTGEEVEISPEALGAA